MRGCQGLALIVDRSSLCSVKSRPSVTRTLKKEAVYRAKAGVDSAMDEFKVSLPFPSPALSFCPSQSSETALCTSFQSSNNADRYIRTFSQLFNDLRSSSSRSSSSLKSDRKRVPGFSTVMTGGVKKKQKRFAKAT